MSEFERGEWHALNRVLALLQTYDQRMVKKSELYQDIMELRPMGAAEEFFQEDEVLYERRRPFLPDQIRVEQGDWFRAGGDCICEKCGCTYYQHTHVIGYRWLRRLCDGTLVKL